MESGNGAATTRWRARGHGRWALAAEGEAARRARWTWCRCLWASRRTLRRRVCIAVEGDGAVVVAKGCAGTRKSGGGMGMGKVLVLFSKRGRRADRVTESPSRIYPRFRPAWVVLPPAALRTRAESSGRAVDAPMGQSCSGFRDYALAHADSSSRAQCTSTLRVRAGALNVVKMSARSSSLHYRYIGAGADTQNDGWNAQ